MSNAKLTYNGQEYEFPLVAGTENEVGVDIATLRDRTGIVTYDPGFASTACCKSDITFIDASSMREDPNYLGIGTQFFLCYLTAAEALNLAEAA